MLPNFANVTFSKNEDVTFSRREKGVKGVKMSVIGPPPSDRPSLNDGLLVKRSVPRRGRKTIRLVSGPFERDVTGLYGS